MPKYDFDLGANLIENLTTGMYHDSKVIYREYIQNACDQIDKAEQLGILKQRNTMGKYPDLGEGIINIWLKPNERYIAIEDNATGIKAIDFQRTLSNIADSDKVMGKDKGFRGIGRLCGLAYCRQLVFTSRWMGEDVISIMTCNALKMREMINETNTKKQRHSMLDVLRAMVEFDTRQVQKDDAEHFFKVELIDINEENEELFGGIDVTNTEQLTDYLSFVAPVPYHADFYYRSEIYEYAKKHGVKIDEYNIKIEGKQIFKKYKTRLKTGNGDDEVYGVKFREFLADDDTLLAWMWYGETNFKAAIKDGVISRGLRLRKENIQIGEENTLRSMFHEPRGNSYFIGEIFGVSSELIPNSQRSYFNENHIRIKFEHELKAFFHDELHRVYHDGSDTNAAINKIKSYDAKEIEFKTKVENGTFMSNEERETEQTALEKSKQDALTARRRLEKRREDGRPIERRIIERRIREITPEVTPHPTPNTQADAIKNDWEQSPLPTSLYSGKKFLVDSMFPAHNKRERKLLADTLTKIFTIISNSVDKKTAENIINKIKEGLK